MAPWPGYFISFEGLDGAGKSTQVASLAGTLRVTKRDVLTVRPNNTLLGEILHAFVLQHQRGPAVEPWAEALLFNAERVQLLHEVILPALQRGIPVPDAYKTERPGTDADLNAYDVVYVSGQANAGRLPNKSSKYLWTRPPDAMSGIVNGFVS